MVRSENKNVAAPGIDKIIAQLIDKDLVAGVDRAARDQFSAPAGAADKHVEIVAERFRRRINQILLTHADDARQGEEEEKFLLLDLHDLVIGARHHIDVIAAQHDELGHLPQQIRRRPAHGTTDNAVERRLHRAGRDLEGLQKIRADSDRHHHCDQDHLAVLPPVRFPGHRC